MTPAQSRRARLSDPAQYAETTTALLLAEVGASLPYAIRGQEAADMAAIAAVHDLEMAGMVRRSAVQCEGQIVKVAIRRPVVVPARGRASELAA